MVRIYISGPIAGTPDYEERFAEAASAIQADGHTYINPAMLPRMMPGRSYEWYLDYDMDMIRHEADAICMLPGWARSRGARMERELARKLGLPFYDLKTGEFRHEG